MRLLLLPRSPTCTNRVTQFHHLICRHKRASKLCQYTLCWLCENLESCQYGTQSSMSTQWTRKDHVPQIPCCNGHLNHARVLSICSTLPYPQNSTQRMLCEADYQGASKKMDGGSGKKGHIRKVTWIGTHTPGHGL